MILSMFAVRDLKSDQFGSPMFLPSTGVAIRSFGSEVNRADAQNTVYMYPDDFELFELGEFDTSTGLFEVHAPKSVALGSSLKIRSS